MIEEDLLNRIAKAMGAIMAIVIFGLSITWSANGFGDLAPEWVWAGWILAIFVNVLELIWNEGGARNNMTMTMSCAFAYLYSIITNFIGILAMMNIAMGSIQNNFLSAVLAGILAVLVDVTPEPMIVWALGLSKDGNRDPLAMGLDLFSKAAPTQRKTRQMSFGDAPRGTTIRPEPAPWEENR